jgi:hypothetical protein
MVARGAIGRKKWAVVALVEASSEGTIEGGAASMMTVREEVEVRPDWSVVR